MAGRAFPQRAAGPAETEDAPRGLRHRIGIGRPPSGVRAITESERLRDLEEIHIILHSPAIEALNAFLLSPKARSLKLLHIDGQGIDDNALAVIGSAPTLPRLHTLWLHRGGYTHVGVSVLAGSRSFPNLVALDLGHTPIGNAGAAALARAKWPLRVLELSACGVGPEMVELACSYLMFRLVDLNMSNNLLAPECISELTKWPWFRRLRALSLANNGIADAAVIGLGDAEDMPELLSLDISIPYQGRPAMKVGPVNNFLERLPAPNLRWLTLNNLPVGARAKKLIAERGYRVTPALA